MPHSSGGGGGSFGGGGGSFGGGGSGGSSNHTSRNYFPGATRYVYYHNGEPHYVYSNTDISKGSSKWRFLIFLFYIPFIAFIIPLLITNVFHNPKKMDTNYDTSIVIEDNAGVLGDTTELNQALTDFFNETGIAPSVVTIYNEDLARLHYEDLEAYAYDCYLDHFSDESHWLITYSEPIDPSDGDLYYWEGMQGDDTDKILTSKILGEFNPYLNRLLAEGDRPDVARSITMAFNDITPRIMKPGINLKGASPAIFMFLFIALHAGLMLASMLKMGRYKGAKAITLSAGEKKCNSCGGRYAVGTGDTCPYCGAPIDGREDVVIRTDPEEKYYDETTVDPIDQPFISQNDDQYRGKVRAEDIDNSELPLSERVKGIFKSNNDIE